MVLSWSDGVWHHLCFLKGKVSYLHSNDVCAYQGNESRGIVYWREGFGIRAGSCTRVAGFDMYRFSTYMEAVPIFISSESVLDFVVSNHLSAQNLLMCSA